MSDNHTDSVWPKIILWACIAGAVAFLLLLFMAEYTAVGALLLGALVTILVAILLWIGWYPSGDSVDAVPMAPAPTSTTPDPVAAQPTAPAPPAQSEPVQATPAQDSTPSSDDARVKAAAAMPPPAAPPAPRAEIKPSKELAGQTELSERKGEWKYEAPAKAAGVSSTMALAETAKELSKPETQDASKPAKKPAAEKPARKPVAKDGKPELLEKARAGGPDDLKQIKGIGPKLESVLHEMGIFHFDQIASWRKKEVEWVDNALTGVNKGRPTRDGWVQQAKILAKGGQTEFSKRVTKGGVY